MSPFAAVIAIQPLLPESEKLLDSAVRIGLTLVVGFLVQRLLFLLVGRSETWIVRAGKGHAHARQRARTLGQILRNLCTVLVTGAVIIHALAVLGWDVRPLLAGAGILGVALGFGAQALVRDVIAGIFILAEDQFAVGDLIEVNGRAATVEVLTVRSTTLRDFNGHLHFVPNGEMKIVVNRSRGWSRLAVDVPVAADQDVERAVEVCEKVAVAMNNDAAWRSRLLDPVEVWGVEGLTGAEALVRLVVRAQPGPDAPEAARELRRRIVRGFATAHVRMTTQREITIRPVSGATADAAATRPSDPS
ncbi:MAG: mechanosensitive ion channel family protein [Candidatus Eisenbacteria bacterium]